MSRFFFFLLALFSASSQAFTTLDPYMVPAEIRQVGDFISADGNNIKVNVIGKGYGANQPYFTRAVTIPKSQFLSWLRANLKNLMKINPWWIAFAAFLAAADWAFDAILGMYVKPVNNFVRGLCHPQMIAMTTAECIAVSKNQLGGTEFATYGAWYKNTVDFPNSSIYSIAFQWKRPGSSSFSYGKVNMAAQADSFQTVSQPMTDQQLLDNFVAQMLKQPSQAAQALSSPNGYPYDDLFKGVDMKYIPGISEADYPALDCYFRGALQTSNAGAACYATETEYQRIKQMAEQIKAAATPGGAADALNDKLKDPLTQAQLEESLNKLSDADVSGVTTDAADIYDEGYKQLSDSIVGNTLPGMPDISPLPQFETGSCRSITLNFSLAGQHITKEFPGKTGCEQFEKLKEFMGWLLAMGVIFTLTFTALREAN